VPELIDTLKAIHLLHGNSAVLRIFAARRFPIAAALTRICFINPEKSEVAEDELCATMDLLLSAARAIDVEDAEGTRIQEEPKQYLEQWSNLRGAHWYSVHADPSGLKYYRLTAAGREAHTILASIEVGRSVSTESRLKRFIDLANDLSARASGSPDRRISELRTQIQRAEREIAEIERTGRVEVMPEREVIAEFEELLRLHGAIGADLDQVRALMARHRASTQDIVMTSEAPKGQLLDLVFCEEDKVRDTDEYASLDAFRQLLTDDQLRSAIRRKVEELKRHAVIHKRFIATGKAPARFDGAVESFFDRSRKIDANSPAITSNCAASSSAKTSTRCAPSAAPTSRSGRGSSMCATTSRRRQGIRGSRVSASCCRVRRSSRIRRRIFAFPPTSRRAPGRRRQPMPRTTSRTPMPSSERCAAKRMLPARN
jgi:hypothetical protein